MFRIAAVPGQAAAVLTAALFLLPADPAAATAANPVPDGRTESGRTESGRTESGRTESGRTESGGADPSELVLRHDDPKVREVVQQLINWQQSFTTVRIAMTMFDREELKASNSGFPDDAVLDGTRWGLRSMIWYEQPYRFWFCHENLLDGRIDIRQVGAVSGFRYWIGYSSGGTPGDFRSIPFSHLEILPLHPLASPVYYLRRYHPLNAYCRLIAMKGIWNEDGCCWIGDWLAEHPQLKLLPEEEVDGSRCIVVEGQFRDSAVSAGDTVERWWFDPEQQYLPRKYLRLGPALSIDGQRRKLPTTWQADGYRQFNDLVFPSSGTYSREYIRGRTGQLAVQTFEWAVLEVAADDPLLDEYVEPPDPSSETWIYANDFDPTGSLDVSGKHTEAAHRRNRPSVGSQLRDPAVLVLAGVFVVGVLMVLWQYLRQRQRAVHNG